MKSIMPSLHPFKFPLRIYLVAALLEGILVLAGLLLIPGDPKNAWLWGLSRSRLFMLLVAFLFVVFVGIQVRRLLRDRTRLQALDVRIEKATAQAGHLTTAIVLSLAGLVGGIIFLDNTFSTTDLFLKGYYVRLAPWMFWFTALSGQTLLFLVFRDFSGFKKYLAQHSIALLAVLLILVAGSFAHIYLWDLSPEAWDINKLFDGYNQFNIYKQDIYAVYREGTNLLAGINPYSRVHQLGKDLTWNFEIPTYFPVFYLLNAFTQKIGFQDFFYWLDLWRVVFLISNLGIAYLLFFIPYHRWHHLGFAVFSALFWLFNRWTLHITMIYHIDFIAIFFLVLSLALWPKNKVYSLLSFGVSLGVKQIAIFIFPLYLIWIWQVEKVYSWKRFATLTFVLCFLPLLYVGPFLLWDASGFIKSVLLSATRNAESHFGIPSIDALLGMSSVAAKIPMLSLMALTYLLAWKRKIHHFVAALMLMAIFVNFNSVLFRQYMTWVVALLPLALSAALASRREEQDG
jgi:hypothetical protein